MVQWEYKSVTFDVKGFWGGELDINEFDRTTNKYGREGWELVSCFDTSYSQGGTKYIVAAFKRPLN